MRLLVARDDRYKVITLQRALSIIKYATLVFDGRTMLHRIRELQTALGIEEPQLLQMARWCAGDAKIRAVAELMAVAQLDLLHELQALALVAA